MIKNFLRHPRRFADLWKLSVFEYLHDIRISPMLIPLLLARCQVTADKAKACTMECHAYRNTSLPSENQHYDDFYLCTYVCIWIKRVCNNKDSTNLVSKATHNSTTDAGDSQVAYILHKFSPHPNSQKNSNHLLTGYKTVLHLIGSWGNGKFRVHGKGCFIILF